MTTAALPAEFSDLSRFAGAWALPNEEARHYKLLASTFDELREFYDAMLPRYEAIVGYLNRFPLEAMPADAQRLFDLAMTFVETAHPVDLKWGRVEIRDPVPMEAMQYMPPSRS
jgi:hypothetical protein